MTVAVRDTARRGSAQVTTLPRRTLRSPEDAVAVAEQFAEQISVEAIERDRSGRLPAAEKYDLSRYWRNARTHASHDPVDWKYHHVGNYMLGGVLPPNHGQV